MPVAEYVHPPLDEEVPSISGFCTLFEEGRFEHGGRVVLFVVGAAVVDHSCCGAGGARFIRVPGYVVAWKTGSTAAGVPVSEIEPVRDEGERRGIREKLEKAYPHTQILF